MADVESAPSYPARRRRPSSTIINTNGGDEGNVAAGFYNRKLMPREIAANIKRARHGSNIAATIIYYFSARIASQTGLGQPSGRVSPRCDEEDASSKYAQAMPPAPLLIIKPSGGTIYHHYYQQSKYR